jgi:dTDP-4-amino-4,6-dideoxygalactose transaminase
MSKIKSVESLYMDVYSFDPTINNDHHEGGMKTTNNPEMSDKPILRAHGEKERYQHDIYRVRIVG